MLVVGWPEHSYMCVYMVCIYGLVRASKIPLRSQQSQLVQTSEEPVKGAAADALTGASATATTVPDLPIMADWHQALSATVKTWVFRVAHTGVYRRSVRDSYTPCAVLVA